MLIDYVTGAALLVAGGSILLNRKTRTVATFLGGWILLMVLSIYVPVLARHIEDDPNNRTRFLVLARRDRARTPGTAGSGGVGAKARLEARGFTVREILELFGANT